MCFFFQPLSIPPAVDIAAGLAHSLIAFDSHGFTPDVYYAGKDSRYVSIASIENWLQNLTSSLKKLRFS